MKRSLVGVAAGLLVFAATANAQSMSKPVSFGIAGGMSVPTGDLGNVLSTGYNLSGMLNFRGPAWPVSLRVEGQWQHFGVTNVADANVKSIGGLANLVYGFGSKSMVRPYVTGGLGFFHITSDFGNTCGLADCSTSDNKFGFDVGAGLQFQLTGISTFVEGDWQSIQTSGSADHMFPIRVGVRF